ncbi:non-ribosomal peptide synthetase [Pseudoalteromonas fuliginea]|uniref:Amino acid adenylation domain-containing protein n=1 Tax=Pseudoalteromonas fuliginea TaxID=1872678 RepID=A0ABQ6RDX0_9GAMM|nr:non-ribosomal peptide synthetase [Pseudoalteromonas fuliginea]KAA1150935.1 amino acid adenylation domain-containing protein [Pseudoalteromonas fuliginea]KAA1165608.1 amino acid adenylation domain-containing protein [Pseudoalteromonas fuliginea]
MDNALRLKLARKLAATRKIIMPNNNVDSLSTLNQSFTVSKAKNETSYVLSNAQERMWLLNQLDPLSSAYNVCVLWQFKGCLDARVLQQSCFELVNRHSIFRTSYYADPIVGARQKVLDEFPLQWCEYDLQDLDHQTREVRLKEIAQHASTEPFDLATKSTLRLALVKMTDSHHTLVMVGQHIVWDGASFGIFSNELSTYYRLIKSGESKQRAPLPIQYLDFAQWHREKWQQDSEQSKEQVAFWQKQLTPLPEPIDFPTDFPRGVKQNENGGWHSDNLDQATTQTLLTLAREEQVTTFEAIIAVIALLMTRLSRASEVTIGTVASHRNLPELSDLIGNFGNVIPLRIKVDNKLCFRELIRDCATQCRAAFSHADLPFELLLEKLQIKRGESQNPLLDTMVTFLSHGMSPPIIDGLDVHWEKYFNGTTQTDLSFDALLKDNCLQFQATWRASLYRPKTIPNHLKRLLQLLKHCVQEPDIALANITTVLPDENQLIKWGQRDAFVSPVTTLVAWFESTVSKYPNRTAVELVGSEMIKSVLQKQNVLHDLSFLTLNARANRVARWLVSQGIGPEDRVAIIMPRQLEWFVVMLGTLKAGAAIVPIDPNYPEDYINRVLTLAAPNIVINNGDAHSFESAKATELKTKTVSLLVIENEALSIKNSDLNLTNEERCWPLRPSHPACITFTSGSTGQPKGVVVKHASLVNLIASHKHDLYSEASALVEHNQLKVGHAWSLAFDASWQPTLWMFEGHKVYLFDANTMQDAVTLAKEIMLKKMDFIELTPSMLDEVLPWLQSGLTDTNGQFIEPHTPAILGFGGESVKQELWQRIKSLPGTLGFNLYGPTEATVDAMIAKTNVAEKPVIGGPVAGGQVYVLDNCLQLAPLGVPGELAIAGAGLARGYLDRSDLTASKFIANPFAEQGERLYLSGDRVKWTTQGNIEYIGRIDEQVKIRGFRVEPLEVESTIELLIKCPCAVIARAVTQSAMELICYIENEIEQLSDNQEANLNLIARFRYVCEQALPPHLVPKYFVINKKLPKLPNGKINRKALSIPEDLGVIAKRAPRNELEKKLCNLVCDVLGIETIGIDDGFFAVGGDSISVVKLVSRARREGIHLTPRQVFNAKCIANLVKELHEVDPLGDSQNSKTVNHDSNDKGQLTSTLLMQRYLNAATPLDRFAQLASVVVPESMTAGELKKLVYALLNRHGLLRAQLVQSGTGELSLNVPVENTQTIYCEQTYQQCDDDKYRVYSENADLPTLENSGVLSAAELAKQLCSNLSPENGVMVAVLLVKENENNNQRAWFAINHLVIDASSWHILAEDLAIVRNQQVSNEKLELPPVPTSWRSWSNHINKLSQQYIPAPNSTNLGTLASAHTLTWSLEPYNKTCPALTVARRLGLPLASLLPAISCLAAITSKLKPALDNRCPTLVLERHGREVQEPTQDLSRTIGWFAREVYVALNSDVLKTKSDEMSSQLIETVLRKWCGQIIQQDSPFVSSSGVAPAQQGVNGWLVGFNFLGDLNLSSNSDLWSVTPLLEQLTEACSDHWPLLNSLDLIAYYSQQKGIKTLHFNAIAPSSELHHSDLLRFKAELNKLFHQLHDCFIEEQQQLQAQGLVDSNNLTIKPATPLQVEMLRHCHGLADPWTTQMEITLSNQHNPEISESALKAGAADLLRRHDALRSGFFVKTFSTFTADILEPVWETLDLRGEPSEQYEALLAQHRTAWYQYRFEFDAPPLMRFLSIRISDSQWLILIHCHHLLLDGWSAPRILQEWLGGMSAEATLAYPNLHWGQYLDWLQKQDPTIACQYWNKALNGFKAPSLLCPTRQQRFPSQELSSVLCAAVNTDVKALAAKINVSTAMLFQLAWAKTVGNALNQDDVVFGLFDSGRAASLAGIETLVGLVTQLVPIRIKTDPLSSPIALLQQLQTEQFEWQALAPVRLDNLEATHRFGEFFDTLLVIENALDADTQTAEPIKQVDSSQGLTLPVALAGLKDVKWQDSVGQAAALFIYPGATTKIRLSFDPHAVGQKRSAQLLTDFEFYLQEVVDSCYKFSHEAANSAQLNNSELNPLSTVSLELNHE